MKSTLLNLALGTVLALSPLGNQTHEENVENSQETSEQASANLDVYNFAEHIRDTNDSGFSIQKWAIAYTSNILKEEETLEPWIYLDQTRNDSPEFHAQYSELYNLYSRISSRQDLTTGQKASLENALIGTMLLDEKPVARWLASYISGEADDTYGSRLRGFENARTIVEQDPEVTNWKLSLLQLSVKRD